MLKTFQKVIALTFVSTSVFAQSAISLDDVQVTSNRFPQKQTQTGKTVTIISDSTLRANEGLTLSQILQSQSGIVINGKGQPLGSVQSISVRGAGFGETLILLDGIPVYEPSGIGNSFDINLLNIQNIERIEILKDGQSTIYGSDALAGVINIITKKANGNKIGGTAGFMAGSFATVNADASVQGTIKKTQYLLGINSVNTKGFSSAKGKGFEKDGYNDLGLNAKVNHQFTQKLSANAHAKFQKYSTDFDEAGFIDDKDNTYKSTNWMYGAGINYDALNTKIKFNYLGSTIGRTFKNDSTDIPAQAYSKFSFNQYDSRSDFFEIFSNLKLNQSLKLLIGANYQIQNMNYTGFEISDWGRTDYDAINSKFAKTNNSSIYSSLNGYFKSGFGFEAGARSNWHSTYNNHFTYNLNPYYLYKDKVKIFGSYGTSFRNPALYQLYSPYGNLDLKPEEVTSYEIGLQLFGKNTKDFIRTIYFERTYTNQVIFESLATSPWGKYGNLNPKSNFKGFEVEGQKSWKKLNIGANYTFLNGLISDQETDVEKVNAFLRRPKHTLNLRLGYAVNSKLNVGISTQHLSDRNDNYYNSNSYATEMQILDAFTLINAQVNYSVTNNVKLSLSGQNIFNVDYQEVYGYNSRKATFLAGLRYNF